MVPEILIVEDDISFGTMLQNWFKRNGFEVTLSGKIEQAKKEIQQKKFSLIITDLRLPDDNGIVLLTWIKEYQPEIPVIIMTSYAEVQSAVLAIKLGAFDFLEKPINPSILKEKVEQALNNTVEKKKTVAVKKEKKHQTLSGFIKGNSPAAKLMYEHLSMVAPTRMSVLILGESGTGKEHAAQYIHQQSNRNNAPFIAVDCGSLSRELALSELFGHLKGSFTSAIADKKGVFEQANGGTVFLDEVGNLSYEVQVQLLRALQEQKIRPVGSATDLPIDVRIIAATNENLDTAIASGKFREDLFHRLNEFSVTVPSLRERANDIPLFANYFLEKANEELNKEIEAFSADALQILQQQHWSGNLRELKNVVRCAVLFAKSNEILPENLPNLASNIQKAEALTDMSLRSSHNERQQIEAALKKANGNKTLAAQLLKIDRKTLYNKIHQYNIEF